MRAQAIVLVSFFGVLGCPTTPAGDAGLPDQEADAGTPVADAGLLDAGAINDAGSQEPMPVDAGRSDGGQDAGVVDGGQAVPLEGDLGGACYGNNTCNGDLVCDTAEGLCAEFVVGEPGGPCYGNDTCNGDYECAAGTCIDFDVLSVELDEQTMLAGRNYTLTVELNRPAPEGGTRITVEATNGVGSFSVSESQPTIELTFAEGESQNQAWFFAADLPASGEIAAGLMHRVALSVSVEAHDGPKQSVVTAGLRVETFDDEREFDQVSFPSHRYYPGTVVVFGRGSLEDFELFWGPLDDDVVFIGGDGLFPLINGTPKKYRIVDDDGLVIDGPTVFHQHERTMQRIADDAGNVESWNVGPEGNYLVATPGQGVGLDRVTISEISDAQNYLAEFIEITLND